MTKHHKSGFANCKECAELLAKEDKSLNVFWCYECNKSSIATKPTKYGNCPCGGKIIEIK